MDHIVNSMQEAMIALGTFMCIWGFIEFRSCLWDVLMGRHNYPGRNSLCPYHAAGAVICLSGLVLAFARANTIGLVQISDTMAGFAFIAGMLGFTMSVGFGIWAKGMASDHINHFGIPGHPQLSRIFSMMLIIVLAFVLLGLVRAAYP